MFRLCISRNIKYKNLRSAIFNNRFVYHTFSTAQQTTGNQRRRYFKYFAYVLGGCLCGVLAFPYAKIVYMWVWQVPICPHFNPSQYIDINNSLACTALVRNKNQPCSGHFPMTEIGAATGVNYKLTKVNSNDANRSVRIILNDKSIIERNLFDTNYMLEYFEALADLLIKLDETRRLPLLTNIMGYYVFLCPECRSSITRRMISCPTYLIHVGLLYNAADISEFKDEKN